MKKVLYFAVALALIVSLNACCCNLYTQEEPQMATPETTAAPEASSAYTTEATEAPEPETTAPTEPATTEPTEPPTTNPVPYRITLTGSVAIFAAPGVGERYVQDVGEKGIYTIVAEEYDDRSNLWGKLKSGVGWVLLEHNGTSYGTYCPQCGDSGFETSYLTDWMFGALCHDCVYRNFNVGQYGIFCPGCGQDCSFLGLEENGYCEDCNGWN